MARFMLRSTPRLKGPVSCTASYTSGGRGAETRPCSTAPSSRVVSPPHGLQKLVMGLGVVALT